MLTSQESINLYLGALSAKHETCHTETVKWGSFGKSISYTPEVNFDKSGLNQQKYVDYSQAAL